MVADLYPRHGFAKPGEAGGARAAADPLVAPTPAALTAPAAHIHLMRD